MGIEIPPDMLATLVGVALLIGGALVAGPSAIGQLNQWLDESQQTEGDSLDPIEIEGSHDTDKAAPAGFGRHVNLILKCCPDAPEPLKIGYLSEGKTEADVLRAEVKRLSDTGAV